MATITDKQFETIGLITSLHKNLCALCNKELKEGLSSDDIARDLYDRTVKEMIPDAKKMVDTVLDLYNETKKEKDRKKKLRGILLLHVFDKTRLSRINIDNIDNEQGQAIIKDCIDYLNDYVFQYTATRIKEEKEAAMRLSSGQKFMKPPKYITQNELNILLEDIENISKQYNNSIDEVDANFIKTDLPTFKKYVSLWNERIKFYYDSIIERFIKPTLKIDSIEFAEIALEYRLIKVSGELTIFQTAIGIAYVIEHLRLIINQRYLNRTGEDFEPKIIPTPIHSQEQEKKDDKKEVNIEAPVTIKINKELLPELHKSLKQYFEDSQHELLLKTLSGENGMRKPLVFKEASKKLLELFRRVSYNDFITENKTSLAKWVAHHFDYIEYRNGANKNKQLHFKESYAFNCLSKETGDIPKEADRLCTTPKLKYMSVSKLQEHKKQ